MSCPYSRIFFKFEKFEIVGVPHYWDLTWAPDRKQWFKNLYWWNPQVKHWQFARSNYESTPIMSVFKTNNLTRVSAYLENPFSHVILRGK